MPLGEYDAVDSAQLHYWPVPLSGGMLCQRASCAFGRMIPTKALSVDDG